MPNNQIARSSGAPDAISPTDMRELARQLHILRVSLDGTLLTDSQQADMESLVMAQVAAEEGHGPAISPHLASVGPWAIKAAIDVNVMMAAAAISACRP
jgi:hypothetical protein